jgi:hypothetical protein
MVEVDTPNHGPKATLDLEKRGIVLVGILVRTGVVCFVATFYQRAGGKHIGNVTLAMNVRENENDVRKGTSVVWKDPPNDTRGKLQVKLAAAKLALVGTSHFVRGNNVGKMNHDRMKRLQIVLCVWLNCETTWR